MQSELIVALEETNREIKGLVSKLSQNNVEANSAALSPGDLHVLSRKLSRVAERLGCVAPGQTKEEALQAAISEYVGNLETLKRVLAKVQDALGKQRDRLKKDFEHMNSARAWVEAFRTTNST